MNNMAFFVNMPRTIVLLLLLVLSPPLFTHPAKKFVLADYKLIKTLCHEAETPKTCLSCVRSSKGSLQADGVGIAIIIVNCMMNKANALKLNITNLASTSHGNQKSICERCIEDFKIAEKELVLAKNALHEHKYGEAGSYVDKALSFGVTCRTDLKSYHDKVPFYLCNNFKDLRVDEQNC